MIIVAKEKSDLTPWIIAINQTYTPHLIRCAVTEEEADQFAEELAENLNRDRRDGGPAVSYTHLTLPTNREV